MDVLCNDLVHGEDALEGDFGLLVDHQHPPVESPILLSSVIASQNLPGEK